MGFIDRPQQVWWRRAIFQIHLWVGLLLCLYTSVIGLTGSILVFENEIEHTAYSGLWRASHLSQASSDGKINLSEAISTVTAAYPGYRLSVAYMPDKEGDNFEVFLSQNGHFRYVFVDATTGRLAGAINPDTSWIVWITQLHFRLLAGKTGFFINGVGAASLLLLCITGVIVWWAGIKNWTRGLKIDLRRRWKRINYDTHCAVGFWTLLMLSMWAFTAIYFVWPRPIESAVNAFSSIVSAKPPVFIVPLRHNAPGAGLNEMLKIAQQASPNAQFAGVFFPSSHQDALTLLMARGSARNFTQMDYVYFDPSSGRLLAIWHRGVTATWGARFIFWLSPLHFGMDWGLAIKILWAAMGLSLPLLSISGVLMYWNRFLGKICRSSMRPAKRKMEGVRSRVTVKWPNYFNLGRSE